jgi:hypothetical protein
MEGRALSSDILCRNSEEPECGGGCYPTKAPAESRFFSHQTVTVQGGYGALFAVMVQILLGLGTIAVQVRSEPANCQDTRF